MHAQQGAWQSRLGRTAVARWAMFGVLVLVQAPAVSQLVSSQGQTIPETCKFPAKLPTEFRVFAGGGYVGRQVWRLGGPTKHVFEVRVHQPGSPVVLMLGAYESTYWQVRWSEQTKIIGVYLSGYQKQFLQGLPTDIPRVTHSSAEASVCPTFHLHSGQLPTGLNAVARAVFGRPIELVFLAEEGVVNIGQAPAATKFLTDESATAPEPTATELNGTAALERAVQLGLIRPANWNDLAAWDAAAAALRPGGRTGAASDPIPRFGAPFRTYLILKPFTFPPGLYGSDSATFYVPKGVPTPRGDRGHSTVYDFNALRCSRSEGCQ